VDECKPLTNGPNTNYDLALLKWGLQTLIDVQGEHGDAAGEALVRRCMFPLSNPR
jgi:hypothetical protein